MTIRFISIVIKSKTFSKIDHELSSGITERIAKWYTEYSYGLDAQFEQS